VFHLNTTLTLDNSVEFRDRSGDVSRDFTLSITTYNRWTSAAAFEGRFDIKGFGVRPYLEYEVDAALGATGPIPMRLVPGLRLLPWRGSYVDVAVEVGLTKPTARGVLPVAPWQLMVGLGYQLDYSAFGSERVVERVVEKQVEKPVAAKAPLKSQVRGVVRDEKTLAAMKDVFVAMAGRSRLLTDEKGAFAVVDVAPGPVKLQLTSAGYAPGEFQGTVGAGESLELELTLEPLPPEPPPPVRVRGTVMSEKDKPVAATVSSAAAGVSTKASAAGEYELVVPSGEADVEVGAPGFLTQGRRITTKPGDSVVLDFVLKEVPKATLVVLTKQKIEIKKQVHFATDKDVILPDSAPLLDEVASTILSHDRLRVIRIEGHTDSVGDDAHNLDLSQRRAQSVMRSLLERGISPSRLKAVGYGETRPVQDNKTAKGKAANRRVEFMIEEQGD
jgi:outer membrane protein OmpA-like peptidoglycan-associated protein